MLLQVTHQTHYHYLPDVETAQHMAYLEPRAHAGQSVCSHRLQISPTPEQELNSSDVYGNKRCFFSLQVPHADLTVVSHSLVSTQAHAQPESKVPWEVEREHFRYQVGGQFDAAVEFVYDSPFVPRSAEFVDYASPCFVPGTSVLQATVELMRRIHEDFAFDSRSTEINTPARVALAQRRGVCQDFAHIMLACLRSMGLPARYVSGYLLTTPPPGVEKLVGSDATHAWVSVYIADLPEGARWCDFDPTNNRWGWYAPGVDYVTVATGRDFGDVSPLRGVIYGGANHVLTVGVTVELLEDGSRGSRFQSQIQKQFQCPSLGENQADNPTSAMDTSWSLQPTSPWLPESPSGQQSQFQG